MFIKGSELVRLIVEVVFTTAMPAMYVSVLLSHGYVISNLPSSSAC